MIPSPPRAVKSALAMADESGAAARDDASSMKGKM
jgi:hypothetical protein